MKGSTKLHLVNGLLKLEKPHTVVLWHCWGQPGFELRFCHCPLPLVSSSKRLPCLPLYLCTCLFLQPQDTLLRFSVQAMDLVCVRCGGREGGSSCRSGSSVRADSILWPEVGKKSSEMGAHMLPARA